MISLQNDNNDLVLSFPLSFSCVRKKSEVGERVEAKPFSVGWGTAFSCILLHALYHLYKYRNAFRDCPNQTYDVTVWLSEVGRQTVLVYSCMIKYFKCQIFEMFKYFMKHKEN